MEYHPVVKNIFIYHIKLYNHYINIFIKIYLSSYQNIFIIIFMGIFQQDNDKWEKKDAEWYTQYNTIYTNFNIHDSGYL